MHHASWQNIDKACRNIVANHDKNDPGLKDKLMGGLHFVVCGGNTLIFASSLCWVCLQYCQPNAWLRQLSNPPRTTHADFNQHKPPGGSSLYADPTDSESKIRAKNQFGRDAWLRFKHCVILTEQHRFSDATPDGAKLWATVQRLMREDPFRDDKDGSKLRAEATQLCEDLNAAAITPEELSHLMQTSPPRVIVTRNVLRNPINRCLYKHHAAFNKKRLITWYSTDMAVVGKGRTQSKHKLSPQLTNLVRDLAPDQAYGIPGQQYFYEGILYKMTDNIYPQVTTNM